MLFHFKNDYCESAHPALLQALMATENEQNNAYGEDIHCDAARVAIKKAIKEPNVDIHFFPGGTIANLTLIAHALRPYQAVIAPDTAHINTHETGAIEATGHKVIGVPSPDGKLTPDMIKPVLVQHCDEHWVYPKMVYISNTTELGTFYTKQELTDLSAFCRKHDLLLYLDGARLAMGLTAEGNDLAWEDLPKLTDAFYIGGNKAGAFGGEAMVLVNDCLKPDFRFTMKQKGAIMAKGWYMGAQFTVLFEDDLYLKLGAHSNEMAKQLNAVLEKAGFEFLAKSETNQLFPIIPDALAKKISEHYSVLDCGSPKSGFTCLRFCTSWATKAEYIELLAQNLQKWAK